MLTYYVYTQSTSNYEKQDFTRYFNEGIQAESVEEACEIVFDKMEGYRNIHPNLQWVNMIVNQGIYITGPFKVSKPSRPKIKLEKLEIF